ncbi:MULTISPECIES: LysR family transcriptional regulator [Rhizobium]|jgi:LysR family glycine cleavage system transcriptional activator|uniref:LysR family transcriptional regulator n=1 Tax=Rhizobium sp. 60-20 TaxID=1895819 RepID=UPI0006915ADA|nr:LysR family transcriptional regulator [Rhizobium tropici]OJY78964.1 MAG: hypothetical protein BGP09_23980 [Rhizobium sp. 60-20]RKD67688.1 LysR family transcriptional regulator [Rhizobium sp. WW_1]
MQCNIRALQIFECVFRHRSIAKAAEELMITRSAISHQLRYLRTQIGEDLVESTGRSLIFTDRGARLAQSLSFAFAQIENSVQDSIKSRAGALRVAVCTAFGSGWLIPRMRLYPHAAECRLQIKLHAYQPELSDSAADVFFTTTPIKDGFWSVKLLSEDLVPVGTDEQLFPDGKRGYTFITTDVEARNFMEDWKDYLGLIQKTSLLDKAAVMGASHYSFAAEMALEGVGIALVPYFLAEQRLLDGGLRIWHDTRLPTGRAYYLNVKHARRSEPSIRSFINWVRRSIAEG